MKLTVDAAALAGALPGNVANPNASISVLSHVHLSADKAGRLTITSTDLALTATATIEATVAAEGACCVPVKKLAVITSGAGDKEIELSADLAGGSMSARIIGKRGRYQLPALPDEDFPALDAGQVERLPLDPEQLATGIRTVAYAAGKNDVRYYLNGIHVCPRHVAASDGIRMALFPLDTDASFDEFIIPAESVKAVLKALAVDAENGALFLACNQDGKPARLIVETSGRRLETTLIDGKFPDLYRVIPKPEQKPIQVLIEGAALSAAAEKLTMLGERKSADGYVISMGIISFAVEGLTLRTISDGLESQEYIECLEGSCLPDDYDLDIGLNLKFLQALARVVGPAGAVRLCASAPMDALLFMLEPDSGRRDFHIIMPARL